ncbi:MAG: hypothetical protein FWG50_12660, partial [Kiritimatiellaeota bacterium]|nr:hypothetical protein [Kiritimatiellota bacterium]
MRKNVYQRVGSPSGSAGLPPCNINDAGQKPCAPGDARRKPCAPGKCVIAACLVAAGTALLPQGAEAQQQQQGGAEAQTNAFTLIGGNLIADMNLTGAHGSTGNVFRSLCQLPGGWLVPIVPDTGRLLTLDPFVNMPGDFT